MSKLSSSYHDDAEDD